MRCRKAAPRRQRQITQKYGISYFQEATRGQAETKHASQQVMTCPGPSLHNPHIRTIFDTFVHAVCQTCQPWLWTSPGGHTYVKSKTNHQTSQLIRVQECGDTCMVTESHFKENGHKLINVFTKIIFRSSPTFLIPMTATI